MHKQPKLELRVLERDVWIFFLLKEKNLYLPFYLLDLNVLNYYILPEVIDSDFLFFIFNLHTS